MIDHKFALIGTTCAGKTTLAYEICSELKRMGLNVDGIFQQDRRLPFDREWLEEEKAAQYWVILNQALKEVEMQVGRPPKVMVSDRSVLDFYAYMDYQYEYDEMMSDFVHEWVETYDKLYYLPPLEYEDDGARPDDQFRMEVDETLRDIIEADSMVLGKKVEFLDRDEVLDNMLSYMENVLGEAELRKIPNVLDVEKVLIGGSYARGDQTVESDVDVYVHYEEDGAENSESAESKLHKMFGVEFDVTLVGDDEWNYLLNRPHKLVFKQ